MPRCRELGRPTDREPQIARSSAGWPLLWRPGRRPPPAATPRLASRPARDASLGRCGQTSSTRPQAVPEASPEAERWKLSSHLRCHAAPGPQRKRHQRHCRHPVANDGAAGVRARPPPRRARSTDFGRSWSSRGFCRVTVLQPRVQPREPRLSNAQPSRVGPTQRRLPALGPRCSGRRTDVDRPPVGPMIVEALQQPGRSVRPPNRARPVSSRPGRVCRHRPAPTRHAPSRTGPIAPAPIPQAPSRTAPIAPIPIPQSSFRTAPIAPAPFRRAPI